MNQKIINFLKNIITSKGIKYTFISERTKIKYQRLMRIFNQNAVISGSELITLCKFLEVNQSELMALLNEAA